MAPVLVLPDENGSAFGDTECLNQVHARAEDYLVHDVRQFMIAKYKTASNPSAWAVAGLSEGGTCAMDLALRHSNLFRQFGDFAGDPAPQLLTPGQTLRVLFHGSRAAQAKFDPAHLLALRPRAPGGWPPSSRPVAATGPGHGWATCWRRPAARSGIRTRWRAVPGPHNFVVWGESFHSALDFFSAAVRVAGSAAERHQRVGEVVGDTDQGDRARAIGEVGDERDGRGRPAPCLVDGLVDRGAR